MDNFDKAKNKLEKNDADFEVVDTGSDSLSLDDQVRGLGVSFRDCVGTLLIKNNDGKYFALLRRDDRMIDKKKLYELIGTSGFEFCKEDELEDVLGFKGGLVSPIIVADNSKGRVTILVDKNVKELDYLFCGISKVRTSLKIAREDFLKNIGKFEFVDFTKPNPKRQGLSHSETSKKVIYTADTPTGQLHIGHYVGSVENRIKLQDKYQFYYGLANYHSYSYMKEGKSLYKDPDFIRRSTLEVAMDNLAIGLDPQKTVMYLESEVPETCEVAMLFSMLVKHTRALRNPTIKDEIVMKKMGDKFSLGFVNYPMLQAADILLFKADLIPVGKDQEAHIEQAREIARDFNKTYGETFPTPEALIGRVALLPGLDNRKMSKSLGNAIVFTDSDEDIKSKIMGMYTDPNRIHATDPGTVDGNPIFIYHDFFNQDREEVKDLEDRYRNGKVGDVEVKEKLVKVITEFISPVRERRKVYEKDESLLLDILMDGSKKAHKVAKETTDEVREKMKLNF